MLAEQLTGWDFLIIGLTVLFVEFVVKLIFKDEKYKLVWKLSPIVIDAIVYVVIALISKGTWYTALIHGIAAGLAAMGSYDVILKTMKESGIKSLTDTNEAVKKAIQGDK